MQLYKHVAEPWFQYIKTERKKIEGRLNKGDFINLHLKDKILFFNNNENILVEIVKINHFINFREMLEIEGLNNVLPDIKTIEDGLNVYYQYFNMNDEKKYGVIA